MISTLSSQPEVRRQDACLAKRILGREALDVLREVVHLAIDRRILMIGADGLLPVSPKMIHGIEFGRTRRKPDEFDVQRERQGLRLPGCVGGVLIQQQRHFPFAVAQVDLPEEFSEVFTTMALTGFHQAIPRLEIDGAENHALGVESRQGDARSLALERPSCPERRKQQQIGFVLSQDDVPGIKEPPLENPDMTPDPSFFSLGPDQDAGHTEDASIRNPGDEAPAEWCHRTSDSRCVAPKDPRSWGRSSWSLGIPIDRAPGRDTLARRIPVLQSTSKDARSRVDLRAPREWDLADTGRSSDRYSPDGSRACGRCARWASLSPLQEAPERVDTRGRLEFS